MRWKLNAVCVLLVLLAICARGFGETKSGAIALRESEFGPPDGAAKIDLGAMVKITARPYIMEFFKAKVITADAKVKNTGGKPMFFVFNIAFFDKDNQLLGCVSQSGAGALKPGEETQLGSCLIHLPAEAMKKVAKFQATLYESENEL